jgi:hypothetical protein
MHQFRSEIPTLSPAQWDLIGRTWRQRADHHPTAVTPDANVHIAAAVREAHFRPALVWLVDAIRADLGEAPDDLVIEPLRLGARARDTASKYTANLDARDAVAAMVIVMILETWLSDSLIEIVSAPFSAVRPGWPLKTGGSHGSTKKGDFERLFDAAAAELDPEIESLPFLGTTWYKRGPSYWFRRVLLTLFWLGLVTADVAITVFLCLPLLDRTVAEVFLLVVVVVGVASGVWIWRRSPSTQPERPSPRRKTWNRIGTVVAFGALALAAIVTGGGIIFWLLPFGMGFFVVVFLKSLAPVPFLERQARESLGL